MSQPNYRHYPITEEIECTCKFYTTAAKENGITGTLSYQHNRGISINLMNPINFKYGMTLYAESTNFNHFTFFNVSRRIPIMDEDDDETDEDKNKLLNADYMLMSASFLHENKFDSISFELVDLWGWYPNARKWHHRTKSKNRKFVSLAIMPEFSITSPTSNKTTIFRNEPFDNIILKGVKLEQKPEVCIKYSSKKSFDELMFAALSFRGLFRLLTGTYGAFTEIFIHSGSSKYRVYLVDENSERNLKWGSVSMFLRFAKIKRSLPKILDNWETLQYEINQVIDILTMEHNNHSLSPEVRFLNVARALETFHRKRRSKLKNDQGLIDVVKSIMELLPKKYVEKVGNSLNFVHEPTLRERMTELKLEFKKGTIDTLNINSTWISQFVHSRNYYTHFGEMKKGVQTGDNLRELSNVARALLYTLVAKELGVKESVISEGLWHLILV